ncbi:UNVERIFIED_CONTAM: hypothetical protein HDU68_010814 [Siphonaria sp. JEL0065]|nr:hypothetical protein HDU68_010814 [Siphonaria sp. JEL0065]
MPPKNANQPLKQPRKAILFKNPLGSKEHTVNPTHAAALAEALAKVKEAQAAGILPTASGRILLSKPLVNAPTAPTAPDHNHTDGEFHMDDDPKPDPMPPSPSSPMLPHQFPLSNETSEADEWYDVEEEPDPFTSINHFVYGTHTSGSRRSHSDRRKREAEGWAYNVAFSLEMLATVKKFQQGRVKMSTYAAAMALFNDHPLYLNRVKNTIYQQFLPSFNEYCRCLHLYSHLRWDDVGYHELGPGKTLCLCMGGSREEDVGSQYPRIRCNDACFSFKKKNVSSGGGGRHVDSTLSSAFFIQANVDYIKDLKLREKSLCGTVFRAGEDNQLRDQRCDINAIFGSCCRHQVMEFVIDVPKGEKLSDPVTAFLYLVSTYPGAKIIFFYDIVCKLLAHMKAQGLNIQPYLAMVPMLHIPVHGSICQVAYGPKLSLGSGSLDGENIERTWADLEYHVAPTINQTFENREDSISLILENNATTKNKVFIPFVTKSIENAFTGIATVMTTLASFGGGELKSYLDTVKENIQTRSSLYNNPSYSKDEFGTPELAAINYVKSKADHVQDEALDIWSQLTSLAAEFQAIKNVSDLRRGTKAVTKATSQIRNVMTKMKELMALFNTLPDRHTQLESASVTETEDGGDTEKNKTIFTSKEDLIFKRVQAQLIVKTLCASISDIGSSLKSRLEQHDIVNLKLLAAVDFHVLRKKKYHERMAEKCRELGGLLEERIAASGLADSFEQVKQGFEDSIHSLIK